MVHPSMLTLLQAVLLALALAPIDANFIGQTVDEPPEELPILRIDANVTPISEDSAITLRCTLANFTLPPDCFFIFFFQNETAPIGKFISLSKCVTYFTVKTD